MYLTCLSFYFTQYDLTTGALQSLKTLVDALEAVAVSPDQGIYILHPQRDAELIARSRRELQKAGKHYVLVSVDVEKDSAHPLDVNLPPDKRQILDSWYPVP